MELSNEMTPIALSLMTLMIEIIAFMVMFGQRVPISQLLINIILAGLFIVTVPSIFFTLQSSEEQLSKTFQETDYTKGQDVKKGVSLLIEIVRSNVADLYFFAKNNYKKKDYNNDFTDASFTSGYRRWDEKIKLGKEGDLKEEGFRNNKKISEDDLHKVVFDNGILQAEDDDKDSYKGFILHPLTDGIGKG